MAAAPAFVGALEAGAPDRLRELATVDFAFTGLAPARLALEAFIALERGFHAAMSEVVYAPALVGVEEDRVTLAIHVAGRHTGELVLGPDAEPIAPTGRRFALPEQHPVYTIRAGRVARAEMGAVPGAGVEGILRQLGVGG